MALGQLGQDVHVRGVALLGFSPPGEAKFFEEDGLELLGRMDVETFPCRR
jgi:hypothetical protein